MSETHYCNSLGGKRLHSGLLYMSVSRRRRGHPYGTCHFGPWGSDGVVLGSFDRSGKGNNAGVPRTHTSYTGRDPRHPEPTTRSQQVWGSTVVWTALCCYERSSSEHRC